MDLDRRSTSATVLRPTGLTRMDRAGPPGGRRRRASGHSGSESPVVFCGHGVTCHPPRPLARPRLWRQALGHNIPRVCQLAVRPVARAMRARSGAQPNSESGPGGPGPQAGPLRSRRRGPTRELQKPESSRLSARACVCARARPRVCGRPRAARGPLEACVLRAEQRLIPHRELHVPPGGAELGLASAPVPACRSCSSASTSETATTVMRPPPIRVRLVTQARR